MSRADVARTGAPGNEHARFASAERMQNDARLIPSPSALLLDGRSGIEDRVRARQRVREQMTLIIRTLVTATGAPPDADTLKIPASRAKKIVSSSPQLAPQPRPGGTSEIVAAGPPPAGTFFSVLRAQKPTHAPSGEKNGASPPSVPGIDVASARSMSRDNSCGAPLSVPAKTTRRPSGEIAIAVCTGRNDPDTREPIS